MLNVVICDDNVRVLDRLAQMLESIFIENNIDGKLLFKSGNPSDILDFISYNVANVFILDINLKSNISGIELAQKIRKHNKSAYLIFTTGHLEYAMLAYQVKTFDYLAKPVTSERLESTILRLVDDMRSNPKKYIKINNHTIIDTENINYIKRNGMKLIFSTTQKDYEAYTSFNKITSDLPDNFIRCHKSYIVNISNIANVEINHNTISFTNDNKCLIGPKYKNEFLEVFNHGVSANDWCSSYYTK